MTQQHAEAHASIAAVSKPTGLSRATNRGRVDLADLLAALEHKVRPDQWTAMGEVVSKSIRTFVENGYNHHAVKQVVRDLRKIAGAELWESAQHQLRHGPTPKKTITHLLA